MVALSSPQSSKYCWVVAAACFWSNFCILGVMRSSAVIFVALLNDLELSRKTAAWPSGIFGFSMCISGLLSGYVNLYLSNRSIMMTGAILASIAVSCCSFASSITPIIILYGALQGAGIGIIIPMTHVTLNQYFQRYKALAIGIAYSGSSVGSFLFPALVHWLVEEFGLSNTFILLGGIMLQSLIGIAFLRPNLSVSTSKRNSTCDDLQQKCSLEIVVTPVPSPVCKRNIIDKHHHNTNGHKHFKMNSNLNIAYTPVITLQQEDNNSIWSRFKLSLLLTIEILTNPTFLLISATFAVYFSTSAIFLMVVLDFALDRQMLKQQGVLLVSTFSIGDFVGRLLCGWIGDLNCTSRKFIVCFYLTLMSIFFISLPFCSSFIPLVVMSIILGVLNGGIMVNYSAILNEYMGLDKLSLSIGFSSCIIGISAFLRPMVIGFFRDQYHSYDILFQFLGTIQIVITVLWLSEELFPYRRFICKLFK